MGKTARWRKFTQQEIEEFVKESFSYAMLAEKLGYCMTSGSYLSTMKSMITELNLDISHFIGQGWNKNNFDYERFRNGIVIKTSHALKALVSLRGHRCENCKCDEWMGRLIPLEIHHKDGDSLNNEMDNLSLLCPNCHALTDNYRGKNINTGTKKVSDEKFAKTLSDCPNIRQALKRLGLSAKGDNYRRARDIIFQYNITHLMQEHQEEKSPE